MPRFDCFRLIAFMAAAAAAVSPAAAADSVFPYPHREEKLANGLRVIMVPMPSRGLVSYWSIVRTGSRDEIEAGKTGFAHFFEHMMFRGTKKHPGGAYDRLVTSIGADANAFTCDDFTAFHLTFAKEDLPTVAEIESDRFQNLHYSLEDFQTEAGAVYGEYRKDQTAPEFMLEEKLRAAAFDVHPYKHTTMGFEADVKAMPQAYEHSISFFKRFYRPENVVLVIAGDIEPDEVLKLVKKDYGDWQPGYQPAKIPPEPPQTGPREAAVAYPGKTLPIIDLACRCDALDPDNRDYVAARLLVQLAFGQTSRAFQKLVLERQQAESLFAEVPRSRDPKLLEVMAVVKTDADVPAVRKELEAAMREFQAAPVAAAELDRVKRHDKYALAMALDSPTAVAGALAPLVAGGGGVETLQRLAAQSDRVTPADIQHAAQKYFDPQRRTTIVLKGMQP